MISDIISKLFGTKNERELQKIWPVVGIINEHFESYKKLSDEELQRKTEEFRERLAAGETTDDILPEAFAVVKDACRRMLGKRWIVTTHELEWDMVPFDVQLIGAYALHQGKIAEMATGEGKTLVATMPLYLNALEGKGAHLVTVNDYLAQRDAEWMGEIYKFLGLSVGIILNQMDSKQRKEAYSCDITYGTNNEFGFDYLRDNMAVSIEDIVQVKGHHYAIVDEVDNIAAAIQSLDRLKPDVLFLDIQMPGESGFGWRVPSDLLPRSPEVIVPTAAGLCPAILRVAVRLER